MIIKASVGGVDGTTNYSMTSTRSDEIRQFLDKYDHEGSTVDISFESMNSSEAYEMLDKIPRLDIGD